MSESETDENELSKLFDNSIIVNLKTFTFLAYLQIINFKNNRLPI